ncbi:MAG: trypsin-like peptidase domain-containing protein, partial [Bdellovibrionales bacterium]|nr:trypsin-like peptidase domain-containing protein [Bdellovibrionales bacterium]
MKHIRSFFSLVSILLLAPVCLNRPLLAEEAAISQAQALSRAFEGVATKITPALVNIRAVTRATPVVKRGRSNGRGPALPPGLPAPFRDFFERFGDQLPFDDGGRAPSQGLGSGVIVDSKGHILTNNHVIAEADEVTVRLSDGRSFEAEVVGADSRTDLAVIKIDAPNITPAKLGDSDQLKIGEWVVAAGTPFGLENTITAGIVSAKGRSIMGGNAYEDFIQTDAAINPGNSGGPLADLSGAVVGINTAIFSRSGGYMGVGFAIPINLAKSIMASLIEDGKVTRGWLGVVIQELTDELAESFGYSSQKGAL